MMITMMEAYNIEALKKDGYTYEQTIAKFDVTDDESILALKPLYDKDADILQRAFIGEYSISFVTINGLRNLLKLRYDLPLDSYRTEQNGIFEVQLDEKTEEEVKAFISSNWTVQRIDDKVSIFVEGKIV